MNLLDELNALKVESINALIQRALVNNGITQSELAVAMNVPKKRITEWKKGESLDSIDMLKLAELAGMIEVEEPYNVSVHLRAVVLSDENIDAWCEHLLLINAVAVDQYLDTIANDTEEDGIWFNAIDADPIRHLESVLPYLQSIGVDVPESPEGLLSYDESPTRVDMFTLAINRYLVDYCIGVATEERKALKYVAPSENINELVDHCFEDIIPELCSSRTNPY